MFLVRAGAPGRLLRRVVHGPVRLGEAPFLTIHVAHVSGRLCSAESHGGPVLHLARVGIWIHGVLRGAAESGGVVE